MNKYFAVHPAVMAVWAAVVAAGFLLPAFPILGTGGNFSLANVLNPLSGIFFGPLAGALCSAIGGFLGSLIAPHTAWMGPATFIIGMTTAFTTGCIARGKGFPVSVNRNGNIIINGAVVVYITGTILWFTQEIGRSIVIFPVVFYGLGLIVSMIGIVFAGRMLKGKNRLLKFAAVWICAFGGLIGGASIGNFFSLILYKQPKEIWMIIMVSAPIERIIFASAAMLVGVPLLAGLNKTGIFAGSQEGDFYHEPHERTQTDLNKINSESSHED